jgi:hypothetical protein
MNYNREHILRSFAKTKIDLNRIKLGSIITFNYGDESRIALVLNPEWDGMVHALTLDVISPEQLTRLFHVFIDVFAKTSHINPQSFYTSNVMTQPILKSVDCYRKFDIKKIGGPIYELAYEFGRLKNLVDYMNFKQYTLEEAASIARQISLSQQGADTATLTNQILSGTIEHLKLASLLNLQNSEVSSVLKSPTPKKIATQLAISAGVDWRQLVDKLISGGELFPPVVIRTDSGIRLLAGDIPLVIAVAWGYNLPVDILGP